MITSDLDIELKTSHVYLSLTKALIGEYQFNDLLGDIKWTICKETWT